MAGCRDCDRCTEGTLTGCIMLPIRLIVWCCGGFLANMVRRGCPQCGHLLAQHRRYGGRFAD